jgi:hypothetical protein
MTMAGRQSQKFVWIATDDHDNLSCLLQLAWGTIPLYLRQVGWAHADQIGHLAQGANVWKRRVSPIAADSGEGEGPLSERIAGVQPVRREPVFKFHHRSDKSLQDLAEMYNPCIRGWINYYSHFYRTQLRPTLKRIDLYVVRWARRKFKRLRRKTKGGTRLV